VRESLGRDTRALPGLCISSTLGIIVGDLAWLAAMRQLGARRVILVDSLKPFLAAVLGGALGDRVSTLAAGCMALSVCGILLVALERAPVVSTDPECLAEGAADNRTEAATASARASAAADARSYGLAVLNVVFDVFGAVLTKTVGSELGPWEIGLVRFSFAAVVMAIVAVCAEARARGCCARPAACLRVAPARSDGRAQLSDDELPSAQADCVVAHEAEPASPEAALGWHRLPSLGAREWAMVLSGVVLVTFLAVGLGNVGLFRLPLSLFLTLQALGPLYALPIALVVKGEVATARAWAGSAVAVVGVAAFCRVTLVGGS
jgi:drug/metabolite transporter (DMT)-like permease